jgi:uncharacterized protein involved in exopolysaccharide biosynthesis
MTNQPVYNDEIDLREYIDVIVRRWTLIVGVTVIVAILALVFSLTQKPVYESKATILLRSAGGSSSLSQYAGLAGMLGVNLGGGGGSSLGDLTELLKSKAVAAKVLDDLKLTARIKGWDNPKIKRQSLISAVSGYLKLPKMTGNLLELKTEADDPQLAADVANGFIEAISYYWNELNYTQAQKKLRYIQLELPRVERDLKIVESKLRLSPGATTGSILGGGQGGLQRDFEIYNSVYTMLRKEYESTKLEASKEIAPFSVVDKAEKPLGKSRPNVKLNVMVGVVLGLFSGVLIAFFMEYLQGTNRKKA